MVGPVARYLCRRSIHYACAVVKWHHMVAVCQVLGCIHAIKLIILDSLISDKQTGELLVDPDNDCKDDEQPIKPKEPKGPGTFTVTLISG